MNEILVPLIGDRCWKKTRTSMCERLKKQIINNSRGRNLEAELNERVSRYLIDEERREEGRGEVGCDDVADGQSESSDHRGDGRNW